MPRSFALGPLFTQITPSEAEAEAWGLLALMAIQASRFSARSDALGRPVLLADQDRGLWDADLVREGSAALAQGES